MTLLVVDVGNTQTHLGAFDGEHRSLSLTDLARRADLPLATAHRLVAELHRWGALAREPNGDYVIGRRLWQLGLLELWLQTHGV